MSLHVKVEEAEKSLISAWGFGSDTSVEDFQEAIAMAPPVLSPTCPEVTITYDKATTRDGSSIEVKIYNGTHSGKHALLVYKMHGGGWVVGTHETEEEENRRIASIPGVVLVSVAYRLAPQFPYPVPLNDCIDALLWCKSSSEMLGINPEAIVVAGCSAGGNLAACVAIAARDQGITGIIGQHLAIPVTCHPKFFDHVPQRQDYELLSYAQNFDAPMVDALRMEIFWDLYLGHSPAPDCLHSPLLSTDLKGLPEAFIQVAGLDPLRDEGIAYGQALEKAGVKVHMKIYQGQVHGFSSFCDTPQTAAYYKVLTQFLERLRDNSTQKSST